MRNDFLVLAILTLVFLDLSVASGAEETKTGSFFGSFRKPKAEALSKPAQKKPSGFASLFGLGSREEAGKQKAAATGELTEEEKRMVAEAAKTGASSAPVSTEPLKLPPPTLRVKPRRLPWSPDKMPEVIVVPKDPNRTRTVEVPKAPSKYLQNDSRVVTGPKIGTGPSAKAPAAPKKTR